MKGIVLTQLADMIEDVYGLDTWDAILTEASQDGIYISTETYPDDVLSALVNASELISGVSSAALLRLFGRYAFSGFSKENPEFCRTGITLKEFS